MAKLCDPGLFRAKTSLWCLPLLPEEGRLVRRVAVEAKAEQRPLGPDKGLPLNSEELWDFGQVT